MSKPGHNSGKGGPRSRIHTYVIQAGVGGPVKIGLAQNVHMPAPPPPATVYLAEAPQ